MNLSSKGIYIILRICFKAWNMNGSELVYFIEK